jgi:hypothetical protein
MPRRGILRIIWTTMMAVCTDNLNAGVAVMKSAQHGS